MSDSLKTKTPEASPAQAPAPLVLHLHVGGPAADARATILAAQVGAQAEVVLLHHFPDGETLVRLPCGTEGRDVIVFAPLEQPDAKLLPLLSTADTARELGARRVALVAPYLPYMRQDCRFEGGQAITSRTFAAVLSAHFDFLATVDPHLHRYAALSDVFTMPAAALAAAPAIAAWIRTQVAAPLLLGPDIESSQWVQAVAQEAGAPYEVLSKVRRGDRDVSVSALQGGAEAWAGRTPVLVDDIVSSARTMIEAVRQVCAAGLGAPVCIAVHAVFAPGAHQALLDAGAARVVSCNTIAHASNGIDVLPNLAACLRGWLHA